MAPEKDTQVPFSRAEIEIIDRYARAHGMDKADAATKLFSDGLAKRVKKRTGKNPARVYSIKKKKEEK